MTPLPTRTARAATAGLLAALTLAGGVLGPPAAHARSRGLSVRVILHSRQVQVLRGGRVLRRFTASVGASRSATPQGSFRVIGHYRFTPADGRAFREYGGYVLALNVWKPDGEVAFHHGYGGDYGRAVSHGCIRLRDDQVRWMYRAVPDGTPVKISR